MAGAPRRALAIGLGACMAVTGGWVAVTALGSRRCVCADQPTGRNTVVLDMASEDLVSSVERARVFDSKAREYDATACAEEWWMGLRLIRRWMLASARGAVLEVAAGSATNLPFFRPSKCDRLVLTDSSQAMVDVASAKAAQTDGRIATRVVLASAVALPFADGEFDTVVDTFGLCSFDEPVAALREMARVCSPASGRVVLIEHGRSHYQFLNRILDRNALRHAANWGCFYNRDIDAIVAESGLVVVSQHRFHFGTTYCYELRVRTDADPPPAVRAHAVHPTGELVLAK